MANMATAYQAKKRSRKMAAGGEVGVHEERGFRGDTRSEPHAQYEHDMVRFRGTVAEPVVKEERREAHRQNLSDLKSMKKPHLYAGGGIVDSIMKKRGYSEGGEIANDTPPTADSESADFDDLALDDDLEESYTGKNSGDEDGQSEHEDSDLVSRIMRKRRA